MLCQDLMATAMPKSQDTMECTDTNTGRISAESRTPAMIWSFHWRGLPSQPMASRVYTSLGQPVVRSRSTAKSGTSAIITNSVDDVR